MKMILKGNKKKLFNLNFKEIIDKEKIKNLFTYKNLFIFLLSFLIINIIIGSVFYFFTSLKEKNLIKENLDLYFTIPKTYNFINLLKSSLFNNMSNFLLVWLLGISVFGIVIIILIFFFEAFSLGFTFSAILSKYGLKGILGSICYIFPSKLLYILGLFIITYFAIRFSYQMIKHLFLKKDTNLQTAMKKYTKNLGLVLGYAFLISILEVFLTPFFIKIFTFILK